MMKLDETGVPSLVQDIQFQRTMRRIIVRYFDGSYHTYTLAQLGLRVDLLNFDLTAEDSEHVALMAAMDWRASHEDVAGAKELSGYNGRIH